MQLVAFRPVFRYSDRSGIQASFPVFRPMFDNQVSSDAQMEVISSIQIDERHSGHGYFYVTIYFGIQANILFSVFRPTLTVPDGFFVDAQIKTTSLPILTGIITSFFHFNVNFRAFIVFNHLIPRKCESRRYLPFEFPVD
jgi:hypothetical protein